MKNPKISIALKKYFSNKENRRRVAESVTKIWQDENYRERQHQSRLGNRNHLNHKHTDEAKRKMSMSRQGRKVWNKGLTKADPRVASNIANWVAPLKNGHQSAEAIERIRLFQVNNPNRKFVDTSIEIKFQEEIEKRGLKLGVDFFKQQGIENICISDFYFPKTKTIIFCDGDYWHKYPYGTKRDNEVNSFLSETDYKVFRFWENEINNNITSCVDKVFLTFNKQ